MKTRLRNRNLFIRAHEAKHECEVWHPWHPWGTRHPRCTMRQGVNQAIRVPHESVTRIVTLNRLLQQGPNQVDDVFRRSARPGDSGIQPHESLVGEEMPLVS